MRQLSNDGVSLWKPLVYALLPTVILFGAVLALGEYGGWLSIDQKLASQVFLFLFRPRQLPVQAATTYLFWVAVSFIFMRGYSLAKERRARKDLGLEALESISRDDAVGLAANLSQKPRQTTEIRRLSALLRAFASREEPIALNEELSRSDQEQVERGHLLINALKHLIPVLGFFGTVLGLSWGMVSFPQAAAGAKSVEELRVTLQEFASSLSVAFETTLLALGYTIILVVLVSLLRQREEAFVTQIDEIAKEAMGRFRHDEPRSTGDMVAALRAWLPELERSVSGGASRFLNSLSAQSEQLAVEIRKTADTSADRLASEARSAKADMQASLTQATSELHQRITEAMAQSTSQLATELQSIKAKLEIPPRYQVIVRPAPEEEHD